MKALPPPRENELDALKDDTRTPQEPPSRPPSLDIAILQALAADTAQDTRSLLKAGMEAYGGSCDESWLDAVLGVFDLDPPPA